MGDTTVFTDVRVFDGTGREPFAAEVLVEGERITAVAPRLPAARRAGARVLDGSGGTLIPGLVDSHTHLGFGSTVEHRSPRRDEPDEEKALLVAHAGRVMLDHGFTSAYSGGNRLPRTEVAARKAFAEGWMPGPRFKAASWEGTAGMVEPGVYDFPGIDGRVSDPESVGRFVGEMAAWASTSSSCRCPARARWCRAPHGSCSSPTRRSPRQRRRPASTAWR
ncbi:amidohydrolase family protein [Actinomadura madurae]|uniref:amidohydrolase family protein n=1 Tax=Actinomadura madurae TaxID=1993 RepID=UPI0020D2240C|nr:amidohydrolase family protein [Actinomadura madurae]MCP9984830.1 amidohydrolase family protein [Actinomadura madurae]MCQ0003619.1 amidohydrolase family protein [Actinomadura madurae]MCQ0021018.1 amidohydrolase family protein [Actinomadura madurae]